MHRYLCAPAVALFPFFFLAAGVCVYYCFYLITRTDLDCFFSRATPVTLANFAWTEFLFTVLLSRACLLPSLSFQ